MLPDRHYQDLCAKIEIFMVMERLGPVLVDALLSIPPADGDERLGPVLVGYFALDTASEVVIDDGTLGPVLTDALLPISPVGLMHKLLGPVLTDALLLIPPVIIGLSESY